MNIKYIDFHTHIFPENIAQRAVEQVGGYYNVTMEGDGSASQLVENLRSNGGEFAVIHSSATKPEQVESVNSYMLAQMKKYPELIGFGTVHSDYSEFENEIKRIKENGLKGIKLHPDFQNFYIDSPKMFPIYEVAQGFLPILFHVGDKNSSKSSPERLRRVMDMFPHLCIIAAHMGGYSAWEMACEQLYGTRVYLDTSSTLMEMDSTRFKGLINSHDVDRILFGSDFPLQLPQTALKEFLSIGLTDTQYEKILYKNAFDLLEIGV